MANSEHLSILEKGVDVWNEWRQNNSHINPDLSNSNLKGKTLVGANFLNAGFENSNLSLTDLSMANLTGAQFLKADLSHSIFKNAIISDTSFSYADLSFANCAECVLFKTDFIRANLSSTDFSNAQLLDCGREGALLIQTNLYKTTIKRARIYGVSAWDVIGDECTQEDLIVTPPGATELFVEDIEVAQFIYLMLNNQKVKNVIEAITSKAVLILGRFTPERKIVLDKLRDELRRRDYLPIVFDFEKPSTRSIDQTVNLLARMCKFVIADITDAKSIPQELKGFVESNPTIPIRPIILKGQFEYSMFEHFKNYKWVLTPYKYLSYEKLLVKIVPAIIEPVERKLLKLRPK